MAIPEKQLDTWSNPGSVTQSSATYATVKNSLEATDAKYAGKDFEVFLQGSYGNDTNIWAESDVDIMIRLNSCYYSDVSRLTPEDLQAYQAAFVKATYAWSQFKGDVLKVLTDRYGTDVSGGDKAFAIAP